MCDQGDGALNILWPNHTSGMAEAGVIKFRTPIAKECMIRVTSINQSINTLFSVKQNVTE